MLEATLPALLHHMGDISRGEGCIREREALCRVYLGMLRFHLHLPASPVDPARKPAAEVAIISERLALLQSERKAIEIDSTIATGTLAGSHAVLDDIESTSRSLRGKLEEARKKVVERPCSTQAFSGFYRAAYEMASRHCSVANIERIVDQLVRCDTGVRHEVDSWTRVMRSFCETITVKYCNLIDLGAPLVESVSLMESGLTYLARRGGCK